MVATVTRALLVLLLALAAWPSNAAAARVPVVPGITVEKRPCPDARVGAVAGCTWPGGTIVYVNPVPPFGEGDDYVRFTTWHELGHQFAVRVLGPGGLRKFARMTRRAHDLPGVPRSRSDVGEQFADAYATCALGYRPHPDPWSADGADKLGNFPTGYGYEPSRHVQRVVCALIDRAGRRAGLTS